MFCVGRTTIREALKALSHTKIITRTRDGTIINNITFDFFTDSLNERLILKKIDLTDLMEVRKLLEVKIADLAAQRATEEDISIIKDILYKMNEAAANHNNREFITADIKFHEVIAEAAQNRVLYEIFTAIHNLYRESQEAVIEYPGIMKCSLKYHNKIFKAIKEGDALKAKEEMFAHLDNVNKALISIGAL
jgi:GntR family transcriptional repressor for pyruvate dehydrogenase complex